MNCGLTSFSSGACTGEITTLTSELPAGFTGKGEALFGRAPLRLATSPSRYIWPYSATETITSATGYMSEDIEMRRNTSDGSVSDLRRRLDQSEQERRDKDRQLTALLTHQRPETEAPALNAGRGFRGWFRRKA